MRIYVGNLPFSWNEENLKSLFSDYKPEEVSLVKDNYSGRSKGFGFVTISDEEIAKKAISEMNEKEAEGRKIVVNEARPIDPDRPKRRFGNRNSGERRNFGNRNSGERRNFNRNERPRRY